MDHGLLVATFPHVSGLPEDRTTLSVALASQLGTHTPAQMMAQGSTAIAEFLNTPNLQGDAVCEFLSPGLSRAAAAVELKLYNLDGKELAEVPAGAPAGTKPRPPAHGSPVALNGITLGAANGAVSLPEEVAVVLTLRGVNWEAQPIEQPDGADPGAAVDRPRQRYSGRMFVGPLGTIALDTISGKARVVAAFRTALLDAAERMQDSLNGNGLSWCVWSRADGTFRFVEDVQVDDAFDTQRRRGVKPTGRTTRALL